MRILDGKVALVTGAASGIGRATALLFAKNGAHVLAADVDAEGGAATADTATRDDGSCVFVPADVSDRAALAGLVETAESRWERLDIVVNNAGIEGTRALFTEQPEEDFDRLFDVNVRSVYLGMKLAIPVMLRLGGGSIVNIASAGALVAVPGTSLYSATKGAVLAMTRTVAAEYAADGIRVNAVCPGLTRTGMYERLKATVARETDFLVRGPTAPMRRSADPEEMAQAVMYLASDASRYVTGVALPVDGGLTAW